MSKNRESKATKSVLFRKSFLLQISLACSTEAVLQSSRNTAVGNQGLQPKPPKVRQTLRIVSFGLSHKPAKD